MRSRKQMPSEIYIIGAGGHGKVVLDALLSGGISRGRVHVLDANPSLHGSLFLEFSVTLSTDLASEVKGSSFHVAVGDGAARQNLFERLKKFGSLPLSILHPKLSLSPFAWVGEGSFIAAYAVIGPSAVLGRGVIVNHGAIVDHDCRIGDFCHIAPAASLGGGVKIGNRVFIGAGANVLPGIEIGDDAVVGAGAVVTRNVPTDATVVGVPAAKKK